jgi:hypothetical protein
MGPKLPVASMVISSGIMLTLAQLPSETTSELLQIISLESFRMKQQNHFRYTTTKTSSNAARRLAQRAYTGALTASMLTPASLYSASRHRYEPTLGNLLLYGRRDRARTSLQLVRQSRSKPLSTRQAPKTVPRCSSLRTTIDSRASAPRTPC